MAEHARRPSPQPLGDEVFFRYQAGNGRRDLFFVTVTIAATLPHEVERDRLRIEIAGEPVGECRQTSMVTTAPAARPRVKGMTLLLDAVRARWSAAIETPLINPPPPTGSMASISDRLRGSRALRCRPGDHVTVRIRRDERRASRCTVPRPALGVVVVATQHEGRSSGAHRLELDARASCAT